MRRPRMHAGFWVALCLLGCGRDKIVASACRDDTGCPKGELCEDFKCVPVATRACSNVISGNPILQPDPYAISFGDLDVSTAQQKLTIHNIGNCTLTMFEASLGSATSPFSCDLCTARFPIEIFPGRSRDFTVGFATNTVGRARDEIRILSDDKEFSELKIPLSVNFLGEPKLRVTPNPIDFGYVAQGRQGARNVQITNQGTGVAPLTILSIGFSDPATMDFAGADAFSGPRVLNPVSIDTTSLVTLELRYTPRSTAKHAMDLVVSTSKGVVKVPMAGNAETPPQLTYNPSSIDLGNVPLGATNDERFEVVSQLKRRGEVNRLQGSKFVWVQAVGRGEHARWNCQQGQSVEEGVCLQNAVGCDATDGSCQFRAGQIARHERSVLLGKPGSQGVRLRLRHDQFRQRRGIQVEGHGQ